MVQNEMERAVVESIEGGRGQLRLVVQENRAHSLGILQSLEPAVRAWAALGVPRLLRHCSKIHRTLGTSDMMALPHISALWSPPPSHRLQGETRIPLQGMFLGVWGWSESKGGKEAPQGNDLTMGRQPNNHRDALPWPLAEVDTSVSRGPLLCVSSAQSIKTEYNMVAIKSLHTIH